MPAPTPERKVNVHTHQFYTGPWGGMRCWCGMTEKEHLELYDKQQEKEDMTKKTPRPDKAPRDQDCFSAILDDVLREARERVMFMYGQAVLMGEVCSPAVAPMDVAILQSMTAYTLSEQAAKALVMIGSDTGIELDVEYAASIEDP